MTGSGWRAVLEPVVARYRGTVKRLYFDESGKPVEDEEGRAQIVNDTFLRGEFQPAGKRKSHRPGDTPTDRFRNTVGTFASAMEGLVSTFDAIGRVEGDDGRPLVDHKGVDVRDCQAWRESLRRIDEELAFWARTHSRANGVVARPDPDRAAEIDEVEEVEIDDGDQDLAAAE